MALDPCIQKSYFFSSKLRNKSLNLDIHMGFPNIYLYVPKIEFTVFPLYMFTSLDIYYNNHPYYLAGNSHIYFR